ncbi:hypothetical protein [Lichenibacterium ramalinae]|uniref:Uncharacterized protein n=1 Tax=Lichenibacterium ramalinae TaxID=2316527 RepID=A0A4Q2R757_9HYPH|nr:hypothetical protein [Lichenibacterium ramalinae]RYB01781.1 hypothetical protein D3272_24105 [Lichenibacterium ramalinae]
MRHRHGHSQTQAEAKDRQPPPTLADPVASARLLVDTLAPAIDRAEAAGLTIIARHLSRGLDLARRIVASSDSRQG